MIDDGIIENITKILEKVGYFCEFLILLFYLGNKFSFLSEIN